MENETSVNNAFLNGVLEEELYMEQPESFKSASHLDYVCKLSKANNGLKQALRAWFEKLSSTLFSLGFQQSRADDYLFYKINSTSVIYILI